MKRILGFVIVSLVLVVSSGWRNIVTQSTEIPRQLPRSDGSMVQNPSQMPEVMYANGWRQEPALPVLPSGYERLTPVVMVEGDGHVGQWQYTNTLIQARLDAEAAAAVIAAATAASNAVTEAIIASNAAYQATLPTLFSNGVEIASNALFVMSSATGGVGYAVAVTDDGDVVAAFAHASPYGSLLSIRTNLAAAASRQMQNRAARDAYDVALDALVTAISTDSKLDKATKDAATNVVDKAQKVKDSKPNKPKKP